MFDSGSCYGHHHCCRYFGICAVIPSIREKECIHIIHGGNFQLKGGTIQAASPTSFCAYRGGAVYVAGSTSAFFTMTGGTVIGGKVNDFGGAIGTQANGTINIQGGTVTAAYYADGAPITDPADAQIDGAIRVSCAGAAIGTWGGTINISGGTVIGAKDTKGGVFVRNGGVITVSGDAVIHGNFHPSGSTCNLYLSNVSGTAGSTTAHSMLTVGSDGLGENAKISVSMAVPGTFTTNEARYDSFLADSGYYLTQNEDSTLGLTTHADHTHCVCAGTYDSCDHTVLEGEWKPWDGKSAISESGNYYLTQSLTGAAQRWIGGTHQNTTEMTINLCLNGHSIDSSGRVFGVAPYVTLNLMNCHEAESILSGTSSTGNPGRVIHLHTATSTMNMYGNITLQGKERDGVVMSLGNSIIRNCHTSNYGGALKLASASCALTLGGNVQIIGNGKGDINSSTPDDIYLEAGSQLKLDSLTNKARVGIKMSAPGVFASEGATEELTSVFVSNDEVFRVIFKTGSLLLGGAPVVAGGNGYNSLAEALAKVTAGQLVTLNEAQTGDVTVPVSIALDLNGNDLNGNVAVADGAVLSLIDSATADYTADNRGFITGEITGSVARTCNTPSAYGSNYKYLTILESDGSYSAHRIYLTVESTVLKPYQMKDGVISTALNYKTVFKCNDVVAQYVEGYGAKLIGDGTVYADHLAGRFTLSSGAEERNERTTVLDGIMKSTNTAEQNTANAAVAPTVSAYIHLNDGLEAEVVSAPVSRTLKKAISLANACNTLTEKQQLRLGQMYGTFRESMDTWTDIFMGRIRICHAEKVLGQPIVADKHIALTFDDGPNLNNSMQDVMNILDSYDQKATFFLIGYLIDDSTAPVVRDAYDRGFELGNHSYSHTQLTQKTVEEAVADWQACQDAVEAITGEAPTFFRYPFNATNQTLLDTISAPAIRGYTAGDYDAGITAELIAQRVIAGAADGNVILLHVSRGYDWTEQSLHIIIPELRSLGYEITTVGGLFEAQGVEPYTGEYISNVAKAQ